MKISDYINNNEAFDILPYMTEATVYFIIAQLILDGIIPQGIFEE